VTLDLADPQLAQRIIDATPAIALVLDLEGRIQYLNPFGEQLTGYALADLKGRNWFDTLLPDDDCECVRSRFQVSGDDHPRHPPARRPARAAGQSGAAAG